MSKSLIGMTYCRFPAKRLRGARKALKLTKTETARRAMMSLRTYLNIEASRPGCKYVPNDALRRLGVVLGLTPEFIATGKTNAQPLPPNDPKKPLLAEIELERKRTANWKRKWQRDTATLNTMVNREQATVRNLTRVGEAMVKMRADDAAYIAGLVEGLSLLSHGGLGGDNCDVCAIKKQIEDAADRAEKGEPMRPDPVTVEITGSFGPLVPEPA